MFENLRQVWSWRLLVSDWPYDIPEFKMCQILWNYVHKWPFMYQVFEKFWKFIWKWLLFFSNIHIIIKSPQYTGGDFMFLYRFVRRRRPQILVHAITFEQLFGFLSFLAQLLALTCRLPDYILVDFRRDLDLDFSRSNMEFAISQPKLVRLPRNEKQTYRLNSRAQMWPSGLTLAMTLTLNFQGQI